MKHEFNKPKVLGATRLVLFNLACWTTLVFDDKSTFRLIGQDHIWDPDVKRDWSDVGAAGAIIEKSIPLASISRAVDFLNTNAWHGDSENFFRTRDALNSLHAIVNSPEAFLDEMINVGA